MDEVTMRLCGCECGAAVNEGKQFIHGHNRRLNPDHCYTIESGTNCWIWTCGSSVYGMLQGKGAHVLMYERYKGPVAEGMILDHICKNKKCVNPDHTEAVPQAINVQRGPLAKLTAEQVVEIRRRFSKGESKELLAFEYRVTSSNIYAIVNRLSWKNIP